MNIWVIGSISKINNRLRSKKKQGKRPENYIDKTLVDQTILNNIDIILYGKGKGNEKGEHILLHVGTIFWY